MDYFCQECKEEFNSLKGLHLHIVKGHQYLLGAYYLKYFPRFNKLNNNPIPFKNYEQYFGEDFSNEKQLIKWCDKEEVEVVKEYMIDLIKKRITRKKLKFLPSCVELETINMMPDIFVWEDFFGSYRAVSDMMGIPLRLETEVQLPLLTDMRDMEILIDTREQNPLKFPISRVMKLECGDYTANGKWYSKTFIERKSGEDFKGTMTQGYKRFCRELDRASALGAYVYIVIDSSIERLEKENHFGPHKSNMKYVYAKMREFQQKYTNCQFIFSGGRKASMRIIPKLLFYGNKTWNIDFQYIMQKYERKLEGAIS